MARNAGLSLHAPISMNKPHIDPTGMKPAASSCKRQFKRPRRVIHKLRLRGTLGWPAPLERAHFRARFEASDVSCPGRRLESGNRSTYGSQTP